MSDHDLLFIIMAWHLDFVDRGQIERAMRSLVQTKPQPIGEILAENGDLSKTRRTLLDALVEEHVMEHDGDPAASLASLSRRGRSTPEGLRGIADGDLETSVQSLRSALDDRTLPPSEPSESDRRLKAAGDRFRILRPHAKGGLGEILVALDLELNREVALKAIQPQHANHAESRARFVQEAEVTGSLEHPGVVPVYGLGQHADGRPFYAMRFVRGDSLGQAIDRFHQPDHGTGAGRECSLAMRQLLKRFVDVCNAVEYAHSRGVLHRDLKPDNIMLGRFGETLVVDWGLTKAVAQSPHDALTDEPTLGPSPEGGSSPTRLGAAIGTPAYMSPEQAAGNTDQVGRPSDVYSLGATLFTLLTGQPPFAGQPGDVLTRVQWGEFARPRELRRSIPPALEAICLKAMAHAPRDRYSSPRALSDDVERWLADEPVAAWREPYRKRAARWCRHHRAIVSSVAALLIAAMVGLSITSALLGKANQRIKTESRIAKHNFRRARQAVDDLFTRVSETVLLNKPGLQPLRKSFLTNALTYYEDFLDQKQDDPSLWADLAAAHHRVAIVEAEIGEVDKAIQEFGHAIVIRRRLAREYPTNLLHQRDLASSYHNLGDAQIRNGQLAHAQDSHTRALAIRQRLVQSEQATVEDENELARTIAQIGYVEWFSDPQKSLDTHLKAAGMQKKVVHAYPQNHRFQHDLVKVYMNVALLYRETGRSDRALETHEQVSQMLGQLLQDDPHVLDYRVNLAKTYANMADLRRETGRVEMALELYDQARHLFEALARDNPAVVQYQLNLARIRNKLGTVKHEYDQPKDALTLHEQAERALRTILESNPRLLEVRYELTISYERMAEALASLQQHEAAVRCLANGRDILERIVAERPEYQQARRDLTLLLDKLGTALAATARNEQAITAYRDAIQHQRRIVSESATVAEDRSRLSRLYDQLGAAYRNAGQYDAAFTLAFERKEIWPDDKENLYAAACLLAECATAMQPGSESQPDTNQAAPDRFAEGAMQILHQAIQSGFADSQRLNSDSRLDVLRSRNDFRALVDADSELPPTNGPGSTAPP